MTSPRSPSESNFPPANATLVQPLSPRFPSGGARRVGLAVDLSDESAFAVRWAVQNYLRPGDAVVLLHVSPTAVLYGADWGSAEEGSDGGGEASLDPFTAAKASEVAEPLDRAEVPYRIHVVRDHDMKERLCLEVERLGLSALVMGSRGFGASKRAAAKGRLGSVSDYCVHHCVCPVIVVRSAEDNKADKSEVIPKDQDALDKNNQV